MTPDPDESHGSEPTLPSSAGPPMSLERVLASLKGAVAPAVSWEEPPEDPAPEDVPPAADQPLEPASALRSHRSLEQISEMIASAEWQRQLEEARAQRERAPTPPVAAPRPERRPEGIQPTAKDRPAPVVPTHVRDVAPARPNVAPARPDDGPAHPAARPRARVIEDGVAFSPELLAATLAPGPRQRPFRSTGALAIGLISGLAVGVGLTGFAGYDRFVASTSRAGEGGETAQGAPALAVAGREEAPASASLLHAAPPAGDDVLVLPNASERPPVRLGLDLLATPRQADAAIAAQGNLPSPVEVGQPSAPLSPVLASAEDAGLAALRPPADALARSALAPLAAPSPDRSLASAATSSNGGTRSRVVNTAYTSAAVQPPAGMRDALSFSPALAAASLALPPDMPPAALGQPAGWAASDPLNATYPTSSPEPVALADLADLAPSAGTQVVALKLPAERPAAVLYDAGSEFEGAAPAVTCLEEAVISPEIALPPFQECDWPTSVQLAKADEPGRGDDDRGTGSRAGGDAGGNAGDGQEGSGGGGGAPDDGSGGNAGGGGSSGGSGNDGSSGGGSGGGTGGGSGGGSGGGGPDPDGPEDGGGAGGEAPVDNAPGDGGSGGGEGPADGSDGGGSDGEPPDNSGGGSQDGGTGAGGPGAGGSTGDSGGGDGGGSTGGGSQDGGASGGGGSSGDSGGTDSPGDGSGDSGGGDSGGGDSGGGDSGGGSSGGGGGGSDGGGSGGGDSGGGDSGGGGSGGGSDGGNSGGGNSGGGGSDGGSGGGNSGGGGGGNRDDKSDNDRGNDNNDRDDDDDRGNDNNDRGNDDRDRDDNDDRGNDNDDRGNDSGNGGDNDRGNDKGDDDDDDDED